MNNLQEEMEVSQVTSKKHKRKPAFESDDEDEEGNIYVS